MNNRSAGPRSFNTLQRSNRLARLKRLQEARILLLAICALILVLALTGLVFLFCQIGHNVSTGGGGGGGKSGKVVYMRLTKTEADVHTGNLILVSNDYTYQFPETTIENLSELAGYDLSQYLAKRETKPYEVKLRSEWSETTCMLPEAAEAMDLLLNAFYESTDTKLAFYCGYRSYEYQKSLNSTVRAGASDHHTGLSACLTDNSNKVALAEDSRCRLIAIAPTYGFIQRYPSNKYSDTGISDYPELFRYVGVPHAGYITDRNLTLESYLKLLQSNYTYSKSHLLLNAAGEEVKAKDAVYEVYYVAAADGDSTQVLVPKNYHYTISGDNMGGFIVTVNLNKPIA